MEAVGELYQLLTAVQSADATVLKNAEKDLAAAEKQIGFGSALVQIACNATVATETRQLAGLVLKNFVAKHWSTNSDRFQEPPITIDEQDHIRRVLPQGLADESTKIRTAFAMAIVEIARLDLPEGWTALVPSLLSEVARKQSTALVAGAVLCLSMLCDELEEEQTAQIIPALLPELLRMLQQPPSGDLELQRQAVSCMHGLTVNCINAVGEYRVQIREALIPHVQPWLQQFCNTLRSNPSAEAGLLYGMQQASDPEQHPQQSSSSVYALGTVIMKALNLIYSNLEKHAIPCAADVLHSCWVVFVGNLPTYQHAVIQAKAGESGAITTLMQELLEFLFIAVGSKRLQGMMISSLHHLIYYVVGYMQIPADHEDIWAGDYGQYEDDENTTDSVRAAGKRLVAEVTSAFPESAAAAISAALLQRFKEADDLKASGISDWWRLREAALLAFGATSDHLTRAAVQSHAEVNMLLRAALHQNNDTGHVVLQSRSLYITAKAAALFDDAETTHRLQSASTVLTANKEPIMQAGACEAIKSLAAEGGKFSMRQILEPIYVGIGDLLATTEEASLRLVALSALAVVITADPEAAVAWQPHIIPIVLQVWAENTSDPELCTSVTEILGVLAALPLALSDLQAKAVPVLVSILREARQHPPQLVEGALDLLVVLLRQSSPQAAVAIHTAVSSLTVALIRDHEDAGILQGCCDYLRVLIRIAGLDVFCYEGSNPEKAIKEVTTALNRLLLPEMGDSSPLFVGQVLVAILTAAPQLSMGAIAELLPALLLKLAAAKSSPLIVALLTVVAHLVHASATELIDYLANAHNPAGAGCALDLVLQVWTERALEFRGVHDIKLSTSALAHLLSLGHPAMMRVQVKGNRLDLESGIRTRSRAAARQEKWQWIPAPVKLLAILADTLLEAEAGELEEGEWESASGSEAGSSGAGCAASDSGSLLRQPIGASEASGDTNDESPYAHLDLVEVIRSHLRALAQQNSQLFQLGCANLTPAQLQVVQACF